MKREEDKVLKHLMYRVPKLNVNVQNYQGNTIFMMACKKGDVKFVSELLKAKKVNLAIKNRNGCTCHDLVSEKNLEEILALITDYENAPQNGSDKSSQSGHTRSYPSASSA